MAATARTEVGKQKIKWERDMEIKKKKKKGEGKK